MLDPPVMSAVLPNRTEEFLREEVAPVLEKYRDDLGVTVEIRV